ncbi:hypothetical protein [Mobilicoccus pelagius]|uniref:Uncharacterized protein n=1 Tax=Mobilicoccus pelagius NBRC 104925 TaxID=1089455 RepID=H5UQP9_9MICO|nr:hypothetical protein [Mobilicoccus pelagius]GAB48057.1 hypothetical protein MOPEL_036_00210 [Mobilicoccus pelagius NBRC 104925]
MSTATGIGSWPGEDMRTALRWVRDVLGEVESDGTRFGLPYLPELPGRGPGADMIGRAAGLLVDMPVDLQPSGWRLVDRPGRDLERARHLLRRDLDDLAEAFDGYAGPFTVSVTGPWTLAAHLRLSRGERVVGDEGARRDVAQSLVEGIRTLLADVGRVLPDATPVVKLDEPSLPAALGGELRTSSGYGRVRAVDPEEVRRVLREVVDAIRGAGAREVVAHCCAARPPLPVLRGAGVDAVSLDVALLTDRGWESVAATVEEGVTLWAGVDLADAVERRAQGREGAHHLVVDPLVRRWRELGLETHLLDDVVLTPTCGLAGATMPQAVDTHRMLLDAARELHWRIAESC